MVFMRGCMIKACLFSKSHHLPNPFFRHSTYQRMSLQLNETYGLQQRDRSLSAMPPPDLTTLPHEPIHQLTGKHAQYITHVFPSYIIQDINHHHFI